MPSKTPAQKRLMAAAAHTPGGFGGVPQDVGKEFNNADKGKKFHGGGSVAPSAEQAFENNLAETMANPTQPGTPKQGLKGGGSVGRRHWRRWGTGAK
jgi:hypothetical protein